MGAEAAGGPPATGRRGQLPPLSPSLLTRPTGRFQAESRRGRSPAPRGRWQAVSAGARLPPPPHPVSKVGSIHRSSSCCGFCAGRRGQGGWVGACGVGVGSPVPGSDPEGRGGPARVHLRPGHPPASQSALGRPNARERVPPSSAHVLRGPHATARRSESEHSPHGFPSRGASPAHSPETSLQRRHDCFPSQHYFTI